MLQRDIDKTPENDLWQLLFAKKIHFLEMASSGREVKPSLGAPEKPIGDLFRLEGRTVMSKLKIYKVVRKVFANRC